MKPLTIASKLGLLIAMLAACFVSLGNLRAHEEKDPVCGMLVEIEKAHGTAKYAGKTYYLCSESCFGEFRANPQQFVSALRQVEYLGNAAVAFTLRPRIPKRGELARFYLQAGPQAEGGNPTNDASGWKLAEGHALVYLMERDRTPDPESLRLHETEEKGTYGFSKLLRDDGAYRIFFVARYQNGEQVRIGFDCATEGAVQEHHHSGVEDGAPPSESGPKRPPSQDAHHSGAISMSTQHETMREMAEAWTEIGRSLYQSADLHEPGKLVEELLAWERKMPSFSLHKFEEAKSEFLGYSRELEEWTLALRNDIRRGRLESARNRYVEIDGRACTKCHLKFRWGVVDDLSRFPDLRRMEYAAK